MTGFRASPIRRKCARCKAPFRPRRSDAEFCTNLCRQAAHRKQKSAVAAKAEAEALFRGALELLERAVIEEGQPAPVSERFPRGIGKVVPLETWREYCQKGALTSGTSESAFRKAFIRAHTNLAAKGRVGIWENLVWLAYN